MQPKCVYIYGHLASKNPTVNLSFPLDFNCFLSSLDERIKNNCNNRFCDI